MSNCGSNFVVRLLRGSGGPGRQSQQPPHRHGSKSPLGGSSNNGSSYHHPVVIGKQQLHSFATTCRKVKDTVLVLEATKGPFVKAACGLGQSLGTAGLVVAAGTCLTKVIAGGSSSTEEELIWSEEGELETASSSTSALRRVQLTYLQMTNSLLASALTAIISFRIFRNKTFLTRVSNRPLVAIGIGVITPFLMASIVHHLPRTEVREGVLIPFGVKEAAQLVYAGVLGFMAAPLYLLGGQSIVRAAFVSAGLCAGLHGVAHMAPKDAFLGWGTPLTYAMHAILLSFVLTLVLRREHVCFQPLYRLMMHGGLLVYSAHYLHTLHKMRYAARSSSYDPVNASMALSMDVLNVYARLAFMLPPHFRLSHERPILLPPRQSGRSSNKSFNPTPEK